MGTGGGGSDPALAEGSETPQDFPPRPPGVPVRGGVAGWGRPCGSRAAVRFGGGPGLGPQARCLLWPGGPSWGWPATPGPSLRVRARPRFSACGTLYTRHAHLRFTGETSQPHFNRSAHTGVHTWKPAEQSDPIPAPATSHERASPRPASSAGPRRFVPARPFFTRTLS